MKSNFVNCVVELPDNNYFETKIEKSSLGKNVEEKVCRHLSITDKKYFSCSYLEDGKKFWLRSDKAVLKQVSGDPVLLMFGVKFYPPEPRVIKDKEAKMFLISQLKSDISSGRLFCSFTNIALLTSYLVQAELGDFKERFPEMANKVLSDMGLFSNYPDSLFVKIMELYRTHKGMEVDVANDYFLDEIKTLPLYGVHLYDAINSVENMVQLGFYSYGILVYEDQMRVDRFIWPQILDVSYKKNKFEVQLRDKEVIWLKSKGETLKYQLDSTRDAKRIWRLAADMHKFYRSLNPSTKLITPFSTLIRTNSQRSYLSQLPWIDRVESELKTIDRPEEEKVYMDEGRSNQSMDTFVIKRIDDKRKSFERIKNKNFIYPSTTTQEIEEKILNENKIFHDNLQKQLYQQNYSLNTLQQQHKQLTSQQNMCDKLIQIQNNNNKFYLLQQQQIIEEQKKIIDRLNSNNNINSYNDINNNNNNNIDQNKVNNNNSYNNNNNNNIFDENKVNNNNSYNIINNNKNSNNNNNNNNIFDETEVDNDNNNSCNNTNKNNIFDQTQNYNESIYHYIDQNDYYVTERRIINPDGLVETFVERRKPLKDDYDILLNEAIKKTTEMDGDLNVEKIQFQTDYEEFV